MSLASVEEGRVIRTYIELPNECLDTLPAEFAADDVRFPEAFVRFFLEEYTKPGDLVFDPFAGFSTTLRIAEQLGRRIRGVEFDPRRCAYAQSLLREPGALLCGDSRNLADYDLPPIDFCLAGVPYTHQEDSTDPLSAYSIAGSGYHTYLTDLQSIFQQVGTRMTDDAVVVIEVANLKRPGGVTTLAWDVARTVGEVLRFEGETIVGWQPTYGYGYDHSYCLTFRRPPSITQ